MQGAVWACALDPTANLAATASADFSAKVWDALTGIEKYNFAHAHIVRACGFSNSGIRLAARRCGFKGGWGLGGGAHGCGWWRLPGNRGCCGTSWA